MEFYQNLIGGCVEKQEVVNVFCILVFNAILLSSGRFSHSLSSRSANANKEEIENKLSICHAYKIEFTIESINAIEKEKTETEHVENSVLKRDAPRSIREVNSVNIFHCKCTSATQVTQFSNDWNRHYATWNRSICWQSEICDELKSWHCPTPKKRLCHSLIHVICIESGFFKLYRNGNSNWQPFQRPWEKITIFGTGQFCGVSMTIVSTPFWNGIQFNPMKCIDDSIISIFPQRSI